MDFHEIFRNYPAVNTLHMHVQKMTIKMKVTFKKNLFNENQIKNVYKYHVKIDKKYF